MRSNEIFFTKFFSHAKNFQNSRSSLPRFRTIAIPVSKKNSNQIGMGAQGKSQGMKKINKPFQGKKSLGKKSGRNSNSILNKKTINI